MWKLDTVSERPFLILRKHQDERWAEDIKHSIRKAWGEKREVGIDLGKETNQDKEECQDIPGVRYRSRNARGRHMQEGWKWERKQSVGEKCARFLTISVTLLGCARLPFTFVKPYDTGRKTVVTSVLWTGKESTERHTGCFCKGKTEKEEWAAVGVSLRVTVIGKPPGSQGGGTKGTWRGSPRSPNRWAPKEWNWVQHKTSITFIKEKTNIGGERKRGNGLNHLDLKTSRVRKLKRVIGEKRCIITERQKQKQERKTRDGGEVQTMEEIHY